MKPSITKSGICTVVTAAAITAVAGIVPTAALAAPALPELPQKLAGKTVFLDPGHQGPNHSQDENRQVSDGRGGTKACQTTGMTSLHGIAEHTINWNVAQLVRTSLEGLGAKVVMSRPDDTGWGGCVDERAKAANSSGADVALSIHADSGPADGHGFHLIVPQLPVPDAKVNEVQSGAGLAASKAMRDAYVQSGYQVATYNGAVDGLQSRADIAGPALTTVPDVFLEMGNGANAEDAQQLETPEGQLKHAVTITTGIASYLLGVPVPADTEKASDTVTAPGQAVPAQPAQAQVPQAPALPTPAEVQGLPAQAQVPQAPAPQTPQAQVPGQTPQTEPQAQLPQTQPQAQLPQTQPQAQVPQTQPQAQVPGQSGQTPTQPATPQAPAPAQSNPGQPGGTPMDAGLEFFQQLADQFLQMEQGQPGTPPQTAPQSGQQPQAGQPAPQAQPAKPGTPAAKPVAQPMPEPRAPQQQSPGAQAGQQTPAPASPGVQANPGTQKPGTDKN
ncbi:N-acetylmuramoyl-L-alanine amidase, partial [Nocardia concava]|uniref:N-acetylmuramoyl-L-alanine amidase n=1 Tax=Nocardia concava TaxID=257281 RepID=UPI0006880C3A